MTLRLNYFPVIPSGSRISFHDQFAAARLRSGLSHEAIDIGTSLGTPVASATNGIVIHEWVSKKRRQRLTGCGWTDAGGNIVIILDDHGYLHYYAHLNRAPLVTSGDHVTQGQRIGEVGNTGSIAQGSNPHLHYQVWALGGGRDEERESARFVRPFGRSVNPYSELVRLARGLNARVGRNGGVLISG